jgi:hypothetical protein
MAKNTPQHSQTDIWLPDNPVFQFNKAGDYFYFGDMYSGILCTGAPRSGKSSAVLALLRRIVLRMGLGCQIYCIKRDDAEPWLRDAKLYGREKDIVHATVDSGHCFDPITHEMRRGGPGAGNPLNIVKMLMTLSQVGKPVITSNGDDASSFFRNSMEQLLREAVTVLGAAKEAPSIGNIRALINSLPPAPLPENPDNYTPEINDWWKESYLGKLVLRIIDMHSNGQVSEEQWHAAEHSTDVLCKEYPKLSPPTLTSILQTATSTFDKLLTPPFGKIIAGGRASYCPEQTFLQSQIQILDYNLAEFGEAGELAMIANKIALQGAIMRRDVAKYPRPVCLFADEFQSLAIPQDAQFAEVARSQRGCVIAATQNLQNVARRLHEHHPGAATLSLVGNMQTRIYLQNGESEFTNEWAAKSFGRTYQNCIEGSLHGPHMRNDYRFLVEPATFASLPTPTRESPYAVGVVYRGGQVWKETGMPYLFYGFPRI